MKRKKNCRTWQQRAWLIDPRKTKLTIVSADDYSEDVPPFANSEIVNAEQVPSCTVWPQPSVVVRGNQDELVEPEQVSSSIDKSPISLAIQGFQCSVTYYADPFEEQGKGWFSLHWLGQAITNICAAFS